MFLKAVLDVTRIVRGRSLQKSFDHLPPCDIRVPMLPAGLRNHGPNPVRSAFKCLAQLLNRRAAGWRTVNQRDDGGIASAVQDFAQPDLQRTELSPAWIRIDDNR